MNVDFSIPTFPESTVRVFTVVPDEEARAARRITLYGQVTPPSKEEIQAWAKRLAESICHPEAL